MITTLLLANASQNANLLLLIQMEEKICDNMIQLESNGGDGQQVSPVGLVYRIGDVDQGCRGRGSIGAREWSVMTPLIRLYTASGYCLALIRLSRASAASVFPTPSSARTITSHVDGSR